MTQPFNYSKWDNIELSDDESDCHPNIDKDSWFRLKHRSRVEREEKEEMEKNDLTAANVEDEKRLAELKARLDAAIADGGAEADDPDALGAEMGEVEKRVERRRQRLEDMERHKKWNWENMCHVVEERTVIGAGKEAKDTTTGSPLPPELQGDKDTSKPVAAGPATPHMEVSSYASFVERNEQKLEQFCELMTLGESEEMLLREGDVLFDEHAGSYLLLACLEDEMNGKRKRMLRVARQSQILTNVVELATSMKRPPQDVVRPFFRRIQEPEHLKKFNDAVASFAKRVQDRAVEKKAEMAKDAEEEEAEAAHGIRGEGGKVLSREERLGPAGLDPMEVFDTLPESMQEAFELRDMERLKQAVAALPPADARYHMKRCEDSGLWVPGPGDRPGAEDLEEVQAEMEGVDK